MLITLLLPIIKVNPSEGNKQMLLPKLIEKVIRKNKIMMFPFKNLNIPFNMRDLHRMPLNRPMPMKNI